MRLYHFLNTDARSFAVRAAHACREISAASSARCASAAPISGTVPIGLPVAGFVTSTVAPTADDTHSPLMNACCRKSLLLRTDMVFAIKVLDTEVKRRLVFLMNESNMADGLFETLRNKIKADPTNAFHYSDLATLYWHVEDEQDRAERVYATALKAIPGHTGLTGEYAYFLGKTGRDVAKARTMFAKVATAPDVSGHTLTQAGEFFWQVVEDLDIADALYAEAAAKNRDDEIIRGLYADFLWRGVGNGAKAKATFAAAFKIDQIEDEAILAGFAVFLWQSEKDLEAAEKYFQLSLAEEPEQEWIYDAYEAFQAERRA